MLQVVGMGRHPCDMYSLNSGGGEATQDSHLQAILHQFKDLFAKPSSLPPSRGIFDHKIPLERGTNPFSIRPYKYPLQQKDIIEAIV